METRLIIKTHTECLRPALYSMLLLKYSTPNIVSTPDVVVRTMKSDLKAKGISGHPEDREAAVRFAVRIAEKNFKILRSNMTWEWRGHALAAISRRSGKTEETEAPQFNDFSLGERIVFLKYFLECDGALISAVCQKVAERGVVGKADLYDSFEHILEHIFDSYEALATRFRDKTRIKNRRRDAAKQTKGESRQRSTLAHKALPHVQAMVDLGLLTQSSEGDFFSPREYGGCSAVLPFAHFIDHLEELETLFTTGNPYDVIARVFGIVAKPLSVEFDLKEILDSVVTAYHDMKDPTTGLASIKAVTDASCTEMLGERSLLASPSQIDLALDELHRQNPSSIRFHVDFDGNRSYLIMAHEEA